MIRGMRSWWFTTGRGEVHSPRLGRGNPAPTMENYFFTAIDDIELEINEDKGLSIR